MLIKIKYFVDIEPIKFIDKGDWVDLRCAEDTYMQQGDFKLIPLGMAMQLPEGYEAYIVPRSSTFKNYGILQTNHFGVVDESYAGNNDQWYFPALATKETSIGKNDRICQFRIMKKQPRFGFEVVKELRNKDRCGFGSTGVN